MKTRALVLCGDCWHPADMIRRGLEALPESGFDFEFSESDQVPTAEMLRDFSVVILARANIVPDAGRRQWITPDEPDVFGDFVRRGNGMLVIHGGTSRYDQVRGMRELAGGSFRSHPLACDVTLEPQPDHPLGIGEKAFVVRDEHFMMNFNGPASDVFLRARSEHGVQPAGWTRMDGEGRVCVLTPGHREEVWRHPSFQRLLLNALRWTAKMD
jgi:type 1 glutamine amidotransferase